MSELQFNLNGQGIPVAPSSEGVAVSVTPAVTTTSLGISTDSSIAVSDQTDDGVVDAGAPTLPFPIIFQFLQNNEYEGLTEKSIDPGSFLKLVNSEFAALGSDILSKWNEELKKQADERVRKESAPNEVRKTEERTNLVTAVAAGSVADVGATGSSNSTTASGVTNVEAKDNIVPFITVGLIFAGAGGVKDAMFIDTMSTSLVGVNPTSNAAPTTQVYVSDMRAELGLLGAALLQGAAYMAVAQTAVENGGKSQGDPKTTAKNYAEQILNFVNSDQLNNIVKALVIQKSDPGKPLDKSLVQTLQTQLKAILLSSALTALYTSETESGTGWITPEEFEGLLSGQNETFGPNKDSMDKILNQLKAVLASLPDGGASLREGLASFFGKNPSLDILTNPSKVLAGIQPFFKRSATQVPI